MAAPGYGPGAGSPGVPSPEDSTRDVGRISLEFRGAPESSQDARRSNTRLERAPSTPPWPAAGSPSPSPGLGAGRRSGPFPAPGNAWAPALGHHVGAPGVARCSRNQPPKTAPARALARPQTGLSGSPGLASPLKPIWRGLRHLLQTGNRLPIDPKPRDCLSSSPQLPGFLTHPSRLRSLVLGGGSGGGGSFSGSFSRQYGGSAGRQPETDKQLNIQPGEETRSPPHSLVYREERV